MPSKDAPALDKFRENLKTVRIARGFSGADLGDCANLSPKTKRVHDIEEGRGAPTLAEVIALCETLEVPIDAMLKHNAEATIIFTNEEGNPVTYAE
jgi:DNA-binding XRE family transcriptional regulator